MSAAVPAGSAQPPPNQAGVDVAAVASVVSALAAIGALWLALQTVLETQALRREERLARLPELFADLSAKMVQKQGRGLGPWSRRVYPIERARLAAALAALDDELPACRAIASGEAFAHPPDVPVDVVEKLTQAALDELAGLISQHR
jgi:hypothetical protein